jgi:hypothetical protein
MQLYGYRLSTTNVLLRHAVVSDGTVVLRNASQQSYHK